MNFFNIDKEQQFEFSCSNIFDSPWDSFDDNVFTVQEDKTKEFNSDTDSIEKAAVSTLQITKITKKLRKKKLSKQEREINKREKDRQRAKRNRERKKEQYKIMEEEVDALKDENQRLRDYINFLQGVQPVKH